MALLRRNTESIWSAEASINTVPAVVLVKVTIPNRATNSAAMIIEEGLRLKYFDIMLQACPLEALHSCAFRRTVLGISLAWLLPSCVAEQVVNRAGPYLANLVEGCPSLKDSPPQCFNDIGCCLDWRMT